MARSRGQDVSPDASTYVYAICVTAGRVAPATLKRFPRNTPLAHPRGIPLPGDRTLVAAEVPTSAFGAETPVAPRDIDWAARCAAAHHAIVQRLADRRGATVVPLRPFTLFPDDTAAAASLKAGRRALDAAFRRIEGRAEWVVRVTRPLEPAAPATRPRVRAASGTDFLAARVAERRSTADRERRVRAGTDALADGLAAVSAHVLLRPLAPGSGLILDAACLVATKERGRFRAAIASRSRPLRAENCRVTVTGPWPAYSFVTLAEDDRG
jgi:hypothetical protein